MSQRKIKKVTQKKKEKLIQGDPVHPLNANRQIARDDDISTLRKLIKADRFDWNERYNPIYIGATARSINMLPSRLFKAVEALCVEKKREKEIENENRRNNRSNKK
jgi:hypothetical protein